MERSAVTCDPYDIERLRGSVALIGAGPGDPELLTLRAFKLLSLAEVVLCDSLVSDPVRALCPPRARLLDVGKRGGGKATAQQVINALLIKEARSNYFVVRLKGGDPLVFGRGGEEALALSAQGIACQIVPGLSSSAAVPALAGIPVTHRHLSTHFTVMTGVSAKSAQEELVTSWERAAALGGTLVFLMGVKALPRIVAALRRGGLGHKMPVAIVEQGTRHNERVIVSTLGSIVERAARERIASPAVIVVGEVVTLREQLHAIVGSSPQLGASLTRAPRAALG